MQRPERLTGIIALLLYACFLLFAVLVHWQYGDGCFSSVQQTSLQIRLARIDLSIFAAGFVVALVGLTLDKQKAISVTASLLALPVFFFNALLNGCS